MIDEPEPVGFGDVIREARRKEGWSQAKLGEKAGVSRPTTATIAKIAQALGLRLELKGQD